MVPNAYNARHTAHNPHGRRALLGVAHLSGNLRGAVLEQYVHGTLVELRALAQALDNIVGDLLIRRWPRRGRILPEEG
jgi:hypothetical protein